MSALGMNLRGQPEVQAQRFQEPERCARCVHVSGGQGAGVLRNDGGRGFVSNLVEVALEHSPIVLVVLLEVRCRIDCGDYGLNTCDEVGHVLLVQCDVVASTEPARGGRR
jgi:hypothetical protein